LQAQPIHKKDDVAYYSLPLSGVSLQSLKG